AVDAGATFVALPELWNRWGRAAELREGAETLDGPSLTWARELARSRRVDRKSTRLNSSHSQISYAVFCLKKKKWWRRAGSTKRSWSPAWPRLPGGLPRRGGVHTLRARCCCARRATHSAAAPAHDVLLPRG